MNLMIPWSSDDCVNTWERGSVWNVADYPLIGWLLTSRNLTIKFPLMKRESEVSSISGFSLVGLIHVN